MIAMQLEPIEKTIISLDEQLNLGRPLVLSLFPFTGKQERPLHITQGRQFQGVCAYFHNKYDPFPVPYYAAEFKEVPLGTYFFLTQDEFGFTAYFCLSHKKCICELSGDPASSLLLHASSTPGLDAGKDYPALICLRGKKAHQVIQETMRLALECTGGVGKPVEEKPPPPNWLSMLGWELDAASPETTTHESALNGIWSLKQEGFQPGYSLIGEGWEDLAQLPDDPLKQHVLHSFEANPINFPRGLKGLVEDLKHAGVKHVGLTHSIMGARAGIHPVLAKGYNLPVDSQGRYFLGEELGHTFQFYCDFYSYLREQGIDFVKVAAQQAIRLFSTYEGQAAAMSKNLQFAIQAAGSIHFNTPHFNTDCLRNENLFYWGSARIARAAGKTRSLNPMAGMRAVRNNLINALWLQHVMQPDFDSWETGCPHKETLAVLHALSGTLNILRDPPGEHDKQLIRKMALPSGQLLLSDTTLSLCPDSIFNNPAESKKIYKAYTLCGTSGVIGAFNLTAGKRTLHGKVSSKDIEELRGEKFAIFSHYHGFLGCVDSEGELPIVLKPGQSDAITVTPILNGIAVIGCYPFFLASRPIMEINIDDDSLHISTTVSGPMIVYSERHILEIRRNGHAIPWAYDAKRCLLSIDSHSNIVETSSLYSIAFES